MCFGVVPQQPPMMEAPAETISAICRAKYTGLEANRVISSSTVG